MLNYNPCNSSAQLTTEVEARSARVGAIASQLPCDADYPVIAALIHVVVERLNSGNAGDDAYGLPTLLRKLQEQFLVSEQQVDLGSLLRPLLEGVEEPINGYLFDLRSDLVYLPAFLRFARVLSELQELIWSTNYEPVDEDESDSNEDDDEGYGDDFDDWDDEEYDESEEDDSVGYSEVFTLTFS